MNFRSTTLQLLDMTNLFDVDLSFNGLAVIPRQISHLTKLRVLNVKDNLLNNVPIELSYCEELHTLNLDRNKMIDVVPNICAISQASQSLAPLTKRAIVSLAYIHIMLMIMPSETEPERQSQRESARERERERERENPRCVRERSTNALGVRNSSRFSQ